MSGVILEVRRRTRGNVTTPMTLWAIVMAVVIFLLEARYGAWTGALWAGATATALLGVYLGWRRRSAAVFVAPMVSWLFAWPLLWVGAMIHHGIIKGFFVGLFLITIGWIGIAAIEFLALGAVTLLVRTLRGPGRSSGPDVVIIGPREP